MMIFFSRFYVPFSLISFVLLKVDGFFNNENSFNGIDWFLNEIEWFSRLRKADPVIVAGIVA